MIIYAETDRWILRDLDSSDQDGMYLLDSDPEVVKYLGGVTVRSPADSLKIIEYVQSQYREFGIGRWAIQSKPTGEFIGWCGLKWVTERINDQSDFYDFGYRIRRPFWGQGFGTETAIASLQYGFNQLNLDPIIANVHQQNAASNHIIRKLGFKKTGEFFYMDQPQNWYELTPADFRFRHTDSAGPQHTL